MFWYLLRRLILVIPTLIGVAVAVFFLIRVMPGDVVVVKLRADGAAVSEETIQAERKRLGLDKPLYQQFADYMVGPHSSRPRQVPVDRRIRHQGNRDPGAGVISDRASWPASSPS